MSKVQTLRVFVKQRLSLAAEEIFDVFERTIAEYEEQLCRQNKLLDAVYKPEVRLHRAGAQQEDPPELQEWSSSLDQEDPSELTHIKEEQEEPWANQDAEQLKGPEEAEIIEFTFSRVPVKSEEGDDDSKTAADGQECRGQEPARSCDPDSHLQPDTHSTMSHSSEPESDDNTYKPESDGSCVWDETREPQSGSNLLQNHEAPVSDFECSSESSIIPGEGPSSFDHLHKQHDIQTGVKPFCCSVCGKRYCWNYSLKAHMRLHSEGKHFSCSVCKKTFVWRAGLEAHMRIHTGEKPFSCSFCGTGFAQRSTLTSHLRVHTGEKPFTCSVCNKGFCNSSTLNKHMRVHTGEKPFCCSVCGKSFARKAHMRQHLIVHTEEKPFSCSVCGKTFTQHGSLRRHAIIHTGGQTSQCQSL